MKNALILHGTSGTPGDFWQPSIKKFLEQRGYSVLVPQLPDAELPDIKKWLPFILQQDFVFNSETILIGHSAGCPLILSILENSTVKIHKAILVAGYARSIGKEKGIQKILQDAYTWIKIKAAVRDLIFINSTNDPWGCNQEEGLYMFKHLGGTLLLLEGEGHMGSNTFNQPYKEHKLLEKLLEVPLTRTVIDSQ